MYLVTNDKKTHTSLTLKLTQQVAVVDSSYEQGVQAGGSVSNSVDLNRFFDFQAFTNIAASFAHPAPIPSPSSSVFVKQEHHHDSEIQKEVQNWHFHSAIIGDDPL